jgi:hypothetical protein
MKYLSPFRIAAYLLVVFFLGHTGGGMLAQQNMGVAADVVFTSMKVVHFHFNGADATWYGFWFGFGIMVSVFVLFSAVLAWQLDKIRPEQWPSVAVIAWAFVASQLATAILSWKYFFLGPAILGLAVAVLLAVGTWRKQSTAAKLPGN